MGKNFVNYREDLAFFISLVIYFSIVFGGVLWLKLHDEKAQNFTSQKDAFMEVSLIQEMQNLDEAKEETKTEQDFKPEKPEKVTEKVTEISSKKVEEKIIKKSIDFGSLANLKSDKVEFAAKKEKANQSSKAQKSSNGGIYDEYRGKVQEKLQALWSVYQAQFGNDAIIRITFDNAGKVINTSIVRLSYDIQFNKKLKDFLLTLENAQFPIPPRSPFEFEANMKDLEKK